MLGENGRIKVTTTLRAEGYRTAFVLGEAANMDFYAGHVPGTTKFAM
jgi:NADH dehydrogenase FAD-containing subunit